jgi:predicted RNA-binding protein YlxR (DUF448 family)
MCISCRKRIEQKKLIRLQCIDKNIVVYTKKGRSFYICNDCLNKKDDKLAKSLQRYCKTDKEKILKMVETYKEKVFNG